MRDIHSRSAENFPFRWFPVWACMGRGGRGSSSQAAKDAAAMTGRDEALPALPRCVDLKDRIAKKKNGPLLKMREVPNEALAYPDQGLQRLCCGKQGPARLGGFPGTFKRRLSPQPAKCSVS